MTRILTIFLFVAVALLAIACNNSQPTEPPSEPQASSPPSQPEKAQQTPATPTESQGPVVQEATGLPSKKPGASGKLVGSYTISEVHEKSQVTMIPPQVATQITFIPDGTFSRTSKARNKVNFKDSGQFVIEGQDQLILKIVMSDGKIQQPPVEKRHTFSLSEDGTELKLTGKDGKVAIFRR